MFLRIVSTLVVSLVILGCGFDPLYGSRGEIKVVNEFARLDVAKIKDRIGQQLRNELLYQLHAAGRSPVANYKLVVGLEKSSRSLAVRRSAFATRANLTVKANYK